MKRGVVSAITVILTVCLLAAAGLGVYFFIRFMPSKEQVDLSQWFGVSGDEVAIVWNEELLEDITGKYVDGQTYLPLSWVQEQVNERFYWDTTLEQLIYTLPETLVYADASMKGSSGKPLLLVEDDDIWLMTGLIQTYTDVRFGVFDQETVKRIFVNTKTEPEQIAQVKKDGVIRARGGVKSQIVAPVKRNDEVTVVEVLENWSAVRTADGFLGYIQNKRLGKTSGREMISLFEEPEYTNISLDEPICLVWHQTMTAQANQAMEELVANTKGVNVIAPTWFMLTDNQGNYDSLADRSYVEKAHDMGMQVWAVLDNFNKGDNVNSEILFSNGKARKRLIEGLMKDVKTYDLDGINLDIEGIKAEAGPHYVQFFRELSVECRKNGVILSIDVTVPSSYSAFYNRAEQGKLLDYVVIMGYDEHTSGGRMGSVASLGFEKKGIEDTLKMVPAEKIISGIPFFTRIWEGTAENATAKAIGISKAKEWVKENNVELYWQEELGQYYGEFDNNGTKQYIWMEEEKSIGKKMELYKDYKLAGVAFWKLGFEPKELWDVIDPVLN